MTYDPVKAWLRQTMGLDPATLGPLAVERAVQARMRVCGLHDPVEYGALLGVSASEQQALIESVVVPETYFFRDRQAFTALRSVFDAEWLRTHAEPLRLLCLPCASGEEAFSVAMELLDSGFPEARLRIDAFDISRTALDSAQRAIYGGHSFRGSDLAYRDRHFQQVAPNRWQLSDAVRRTVHLRWGNVLAMDNDAAAADYHAIFCRNLLIYFDEAAQMRTVAALGRLLRDDGLLFVGPSESGLLLAMGFVPAQLPMAFAFRKRAAGVQTAPADVPYARVDPGIRPPAMARPGAAGAVVPFRKPMAPPQPAMRIEAVADPGAGLDAAESLADVGRYDEAAAAANAHVRAHGPTTRSLYLLGLVHDAKGDERRAEACYRKALYLEPDHAQSLAHLALLLDARGDAVGAQRLRQRAHRRTGGAS